MTYRLTTSRNGRITSMTEASGIGCLFAFAGLFAAWATHIVWVIGKLAGSAGVTGGQIVLGVLGSAFPPVGIIHGVMIWFGHGMG